MAPATARSSATSGRADVAQFQIDSEPSTQLAQWRIRSTHPAALAAIPDALAQRIAQPHDVATCWLIHPSEQDSTRDAAYEQERHEIGLSGAVVIEELTRPRQRNVVWVDRYHLLATSVPLPAISRLAGLYVDGSGGRMTCFVHDPSVTHQIWQHVASLPHDGGRTWNDASAVMSARFACATGGTDVTTVVCCHPTFAPLVTESFQQLSQAVAPW